MQMTVNYAMTLLDQFCIRRHNLIFPLENITVINQNGEVTNPTYSPIDDNMTATATPNENAMMQIASIPDITRHSFHSIYVERGLCIICLENVKNNYLVKLDTCVCKEPRYHQKCLSQWFASRPNNQLCVCPVCSL